MFKSVLKCFMDYHRSRLTINLIWGNSLSRPMVIHKRFTNAEILAFTKTVTYIIIPHVNSPNKTSIDERLISYISPAAMANE